MVGGQVGIAGHIKITDHTSIGAQAGIGTNIRKPGTAILGSPAFDAKQFIKASIYYKQLPEMAETIQNLKKEIEALKEQINK